MPTSLARQHTVYPSASLSQVGIHGEERRKEKTTKEKEEDNKRKKKKTTKEKEEATARNSFITNRIL